MGAIERAKEAIAGGKPEDALLLLQSETGFSAPVVSFGLTCDAFISKAIRESIGDVTTDSMPANIADQVRDELWRSFNKRYGDWDPSVLRALALHMSGVNAVDASQRLGIEPQELQRLAADKGFRMERKWLLGEISTTISDYMTTDIKVEAQLKPIVKKLGRKALEGIDGDELTAKEALKAFQDLGRLLAQISGELVEKKQIDIGPTEQFMKIMEAAEKLPKEAIECKEWRLIE